MKKTTIFLALIGTAFLTGICNYKADQIEKDINYVTDNAPNLASSNFSVEIPDEYSEEKTIITIHRQQLTPEEIYEDAGYLVKIKIFAPVPLPMTNQTIPQYAGFGSGSIVECKKYKYCVLTANHVTDRNSATFYAELKDGSPPQKLSLISGATTYDCALLKFADKRFRPKKTAKIGKSSKLKPGARIMIMGSNTFGNFWFSANGNLYAEVKPAAGIFKTTLEQLGMNHPKVIATSTKIFHGFSGGPLLNSKGELIGISIGIAPLDNDVIYIGTPIDEIKEELKLIK